MTDSKETSEIMQQIDSTEPTGDALMFETDNSCNNNNNNNTNNIHPLFNQVDSEDFIIDEHDMPQQQHQFRTNNHTSQNVFIESMFQKIKNLLDSLEDEK
jgi:hypothetical protein